MRTLVGLCGLVAFGITVGFVAVAGLRPDGAVADFDVGFPTEIAVDVNLDPEDDPGGHDSYIGMPGNITLHLEKSNGPGDYDIVITGPPPWVEVRENDNDALSELGCLSPVTLGITVNASGEGTVAGYQNIRVKLDGELNPYGFSGTYEMGTDGDLPGGQSITYRLKPKDPPVCKVPAPTATATATTCPPASAGQVQCPGPTATPTSQPQPFTATPTRTPTGQPQPFTPTPSRTPTGQPQPFTPMPTRTPTGGVTPIVPTPTWTRTPACSPGPGGAGGTVCPGSGDANKDGAVNAIDGALVLQHTAGLYDLAEREANADADQDGDITSIDASLILQYGAGLIDTLPRPR